MMLPEPDEHNSAVLSIVLNDIVENFKAAAVVSIENEQLLQQEAPFGQQLRLRADQAMYAASSAESTMLKCQMKVKDLHIRRLLRRLKMGASEPRVSGPVWS